MDSSKEYTAYNFDPLNSAIDNQLETQRALIAEAKSRKRLLNNKRAFYLITCICMVAFTVVIIYWLLSKREIMDVVSPSKSDTFEETYDLEQISGSSEEEYGVNTSYTVFKKTTMASGEIIVTGKEYEPDSLDKPVYQYCYLDSPSGTTKKITQIAYIDESVMVISTQSNRLIIDGIPLCQFQLPDK